MAKLIERLDKRVCQFDFHICPSIKTKNFQIMFNSHLAAELHENVRFFIAIFCLTLLKKSNTHILFI